MVFCAFPPFCEGHLEIFAEFQMLIYYSTTSLGTPNDFLRNSVSENLCQLRAKWVGVLAAGVLDVACRIPRYDYRWQSRT